MSFKVGDKVQINETGTTYTYTTPGAYGVIVKAEPPLPNGTARWSIKFEKRIVNREYVTHRQTWIIRENALEHFTKEKEFPLPSPYEHIIEKVIYLDKKFKERKIASPKTISGVL